MTGHISRALAHAQQGDYANAEVALWKGLTVNPKSKTILRAYSRLNIQKKDYKEAEIYFRKILEHHPTDLRIQAELGDFLLALNDFARAKQEYEAIKQKAPNSPLGYLRLSRLYRTQGVIHGCW